MNLPAEHSEHEVEHEEGPDDDEREEVDPVEVASQRVIRLEQTGLKKGWAKPPREFVRSKIVFSKMKPITILKVKPNLMKIILKME